MEESAAGGKISGSGTGNGDGNRKGKGAVGPDVRTKSEQHKLEVYEEVLKRLKKADHPEVKKPKFESELWDHFHRLPARYAMDVSVERADDILMHMKLLEDARNPVKQPSFMVRLVHVSLDEDDTSSNTDGSRIHPPPIFDSSELKNLVRQASISQNLDEGTDSNLVISSRYQKKGMRAKLEIGTISISFSDIYKTHRLIHEITVASNDRTKVLNQGAIRPYHLCAVLNKFNYLSTRTAILLIYFPNHITSVLAELSLNIQEAHAFSTSDGFSLYVFIVMGWQLEETELLTKKIEEKIEEIKKQQWKAKMSTLQIEDAQHSSPEELVKKPQLSIPGHIKIPSDDTDEWEVNMKCLKFGNKVASGTYGDLYRGSYFGQDVAIKVLKHDHLSDEMLRAFRQEVYILRKVHHKNVVQFVGASTKLPNLCIVTEFISGGSLYEHLHKHKAVLKLPSMIRIALEIAKGMDYLHQNSIIHRDLKTANILIDEKEIVKIGGFGAARVKSTTGVMSPKTGTYRWMAPEVIAHMDYDLKADVFSFGIVLWELLTAKLPYETLTSLQAATGVVQNELRPKIPKGTNPELAKLMKDCWEHEPAKRPDFASVSEALERIANEVGVKSEEHHKLRILSFLKLR